MKRDERPPAPATIRGQQLAPDGPQHVYAARFEQELFDRLEAEAKEQNRSINAQINHILRERYEKK